jgi:hypothetical protein
VLAGELTPALAARQILETFGSGGAVRTGPGAHAGPSA